MIQDREIDALRKEIFYGTGVLNNYSISSSVITGFESATSTVTEVTGLDFSAGQVTTANDGFDWTDLIPYDLDITKPVGITPFYTKDATGGTHVTSFTWTAKYFHIGGGGTLVEPGGATALDTVIGADTQAAAADSLKLYVGNRGVINANKFLNTDIFWGFQILLTAFTASGSDKMWLLGVRVDYMPHLTVGAGASQDKALRTNPRGNTWSVTGG